ncbi:intraflagellar transport protein 52 homolog [Phlebotomus argentipes]|uniref:intraflagellar transport protein 52 homolog n=1 Tax=Phlebotomus argentipes TaxID=94469 RepID=UPI0028932AF0|nr:intraflagellar transport protein 52 homolog [Phlebotomus argentipes]XP_059618471.1 intraflagellar transport protein 52 homolog [Phlebotomus argentipes]XP_059618472.1 intraflagellar transport protein 52 homolog [Phlebotomus argentipes]
MDENQRSCVIFDQSKNQLFKLHDNYKTVHRKIKNDLRIEVNKSDITESVLKDARLFVTSGPQENFTEDEFRVLKAFVQSGGQVMILLGEGGETDFNTNVNFLLEEYGMSINADVALRANYYKFFHPKEAIVGEGIGTQSLLKLIREQSGSDWDQIDEIIKPEFVYPFGATLNVINPSVVLLTTGPVVYPFNRPVAGVFCHPSGGKILAIGSGHMFHDRYICEEANMIIWDYFFRLMTEEIPLSQLQFNDIEIFDNTLTPNTIYLADQPKICLVEAIDCEIPADFKKIFDMHLHSINNNSLREVIGTYEKLDVQYEALKIIKPQFEIPLPQLQLAIFPPVFTDVPSPALELFDLDEAFSTEKAQLTQLTNKCLLAAEDKRDVDERELKYFIEECGRILNVAPPDEQLSAREILNRIGVRITQYKKLDRE